MGRRGNKLIVDGLISILGKFVGKEKARKIVTGVITVVVLLVFGYGMLRWLLYFLQRS